MVLFGKMAGNAFFKKADSKKVASDNVVFATGNQGSIRITENDNFRIYELHLKQDMKTLDWAEKEDHVSLTLKKGDIEGLKAGKDISFQESEENVVINFKKLFPKVNKVSIDNEDSSKVLVMISKKEKPYLYKVVVDPGHGGIDIGANHGNLKESALTLTIAKYIEKELRDRNCDVLLTRTKDELLNLKKISQISNAAEPDAFVSIHINSNESSKYKGVSSYYQSWKNGTSEEGKKLAKAIQKEIVKDDSWKDLGELGANFSVLREAQVPATLVECGFLSNTEDREKLSEDRVLRNIAKNVAEGILDYLKSKSGQ